MFFLQIRPYGQPKQPFDTLPLLGKQQTPPQETQLPASRHQDWPRCQRPLLLRWVLDSTSVTGHCLKMPYAAIYPPSPVKPRLHASGRGPGSTACRDTA